MVEEEILGRCPKGGGKEELGEEEWVSLNTLSLKKIKIWQDYSTSLELKRGKEIIPSCKIHMVEEETFGRGPKGGGKEELGDEEWVSLNTLSFRKTKI